MLKQLKLRRDVAAELMRCEKLYKNLSRLMKTLPKGSLLNRNGHIYRAFRENGIQHQKVIKNDRQFIESLKLFHFLKKLLPVLESRIVACSAFLAKEKLYDPVKIEALSKEVYKGGLVKKLFLDGDISVDDWKREEYIRNPAPIKNKHYTNGGEVVRSKAEAMLGTQMEHRGLMYRLEPQLQLREKYVYPDFEIFLPNLRRRVYIEHFGRMDDPKYLKKAMFKLAHYHQMGLHIGENFFFTWETEEKPLTILEINELLDKIQALDKEVI